MDDRTDDVDTMDRGTEPARDDGRQTAWQVFIAFLRLGFISFGGPIALLGHFREDFVVQRLWLDEAAYVSSCPFPRRAKWAWASV